MRFAFDTGCSGVGVYGRAWQMRDEIYKCIQVASGDFMNRSKLVSDQNFNVPDLQSRNSSNAPNLQVKCTILSHATNSPRWT